MSDINTHLTHVCKVVNNGLARHCATKAQKKNHIYMTTSQTAVGELTPKQALVKQIAEQYRTQTGQVAWKRAWQEHPDWKKTLQYNAADARVQGAHDVAWDLRRRGVLAGSSGRQHATNRVASMENLTSAARQEEKQFRRLKPPVMAVLNFMLEHADAKGQMDLKRLDVEQPGWRDNVKLSNRNLLQTIERLRRSGRFEAERKEKIKASLTDRLAHARAVKAAKANGVHTNGNGHAPAPAEQPEPISEEELNRMVDRRAEEKISLMLQEAGCCQKCGRSFKAQLAMELAAQKHSRH